MTFFSMSSFFHHCLLCRLALESDKRALLDKTSKMAAELTQSSRALDMARRSEGAVKKEAERLSRSDLLAANQRLEIAENRAAASEHQASELLEQLEGAEAALRESLATASKLHKVRYGGVLGKQPLPLPHLMAMQHLNHPLRRSTSCCMQRAQKSSRDALLCPKARPLPTWLLLLQTCPAILRLCT
jgi:hypothetical protein